MTGGGPFPAGAGAGAGAGFSTAISFGFSVAAFLKFFLILVVFLSFRRSCRRGDRSQSIRDERWEAGPMMCLRLPGVLPEAHYHIFIGKIRIS